MSLSPGITTAAATVNKIASSVMGSGRSKRFIYSRIPSRQYLVSSVHSTVVNSPNFGIAKAIKPITATTKTFTLVFSSIKKEGFIPLC